MGESKIHEVINETCDALWVVLQPEVMRPPRRRDWMRIEQGFRNRWHFPNCVGSMDGKHISITNRPESGSLFHNNKGFYSTNLMALVDFNYRFIYVDGGEYGSNTDGNVFKFSHFGSRFMDYKFVVPGLKRLPNFGQEGPLPHVIVGDETFPLLHNLMRPSPGKSEGTLCKEEAVFNYRLSRARHFGSKGGEYSAGKYPYPLKLLTKLSKQLVHYTITYVKKKTWMLIKLICN